MPKIVFTGGGSAGHVSPNLALIDHFQKAGWDIDYIGSKYGIETQIIGPLNIPYHSISTGKLRRYFSWDNFLTPFKVLQGIWQSFTLMRKIKPNVVFSKGGFVAFPVVFAAWLNRIPVVIHEADITPGLANKLSMPFATKICISFPEAKKHYKNKNKIVVSGIPLRPKLFHGDKQRGLDICQFNPSKPVIMVVGGSLGAQSLNRTTRELIKQITDTYQVAHICGKGKTDSSINLPYYKQFEFLNDDYADVMACADVVISRAGANAIYELLSLRKPHILIPLPTTGSRGDQITNAEYYAEQELSVVIKDEELNSDKLLNTLQLVTQNKDKIEQKLKQYPLPNSVDLISETLRNVALAD